MWTPRGASARPSRLRLTGQGMGRGCIGTVRSSRGAPEGARRGGRNGETRTRDLLVPNQALYQTELHPEDGPTERRVAGRSIHPRLLWESLRMSKGLGVLPGAVSSPSLKGETTSTCTPERVHTIWSHRRGSNPGPLSYQDSALPLCYGGKPWSGRRGSNPRPQAWEACALPAVLLPHHHPHNLPDRWSGRQELNLRPLQPHCSALPG